MYWIVFASYTAVESLSDLLLSFWLPFYSEAKVVILLYLVSSSTRGSSVVYKGWIHPTLASNEVEIDAGIDKLKLRSFQTATVWVKIAIQKVGSFITRTALDSGGGLVQQIQRSYSMIDLSTIECSDPMNSIESENSDVPTLKHYKSEECLFSPSLMSPTLKR